MNINGNEHHWLKKRFFDAQDDENILALTTNYLCNEWLDESDLRLFEDMKKRNPRRYQVAGLGDWGIVDGLVYENWEERAFTLDEVRDCQTVCGLDFGYVNDPSAAFIGFVDVDHRILYVWDEMYEQGLNNTAIYKRLSSMGYAKERFIADCAEKKSIDELYSLGLRVKASRKGPDSIRSGIQYLLNYRIVIHPRCTSFLTEISNYQWDKDKLGNTINKPIDDFNHLMDAMRYAMEDLIRKKVRLNRIEERSF